MRGEALAKLERSNQKRKLPHGCANGATPSLYCALDVALFAAISVGTALPALAVFASLAGRFAGMMLRRFAQAISGKPG